MSARTLTSSQYTPFGQENTIHWQQKFPAFNDEKVSQLARKIVAAELQAVLFEEFIPALTGRKLPSFRGYRLAIRAVISNRFSAAGLPGGHALLNSTINSISASGKVASFLLRDTLFNPNEIIRATADGLLGGKT